MSLHFENVMFSVSSVPGSRKPEDAVHFCVNINFESQEDVESYAVSHAKVVVQQIVRNDIAIQVGDTKRPSGYKDYTLKAVAQGILPADAKFTANATINHKGVVEPTLDEQLSEGMANLKKLLAAKLAKDPNADITQFEQILKLMTNK